MTSHVNDTWNILAIRPQFYQNFRQQIPLLFCYPVALMKKTLNFLKKRIEITAKKSLIQLSIYRYWSTRPESFIFHQIIHVYNSVWWFTTALVSMVAIDKWWAGRSKSCKRENASYFLSEQNIRLDSSMWFSPL